MLDSAFFRRLGMRVRNKLREHLFDRAKDVYGKKFKKYSKGYGEAKRAGSLKRQAADSRNTTAPYVAGDLKNDLIFTAVTSNSVKVGWAKEGGKIKELAKRGRKVTAPNQPMPKTVISFIHREAKAEVKKKVKKKFPDGKVIRLPIGRK